LACKEVKNLHKVLNEKFTSFENEEQNFGIIINSMKENNEHLLLAMFERDDSKSLSEKIVTDVDSLSRFNNRLGCQLMHFIFKFNSGKVIRMLSQYYNVLHDQERSQILHFVALNGRDGAVREVFHMLQSQLACDEVKSLIMQKNSDGASPLSLLLANNSNQESIYEFLNASLNSFNNYELRHVLMDKEANYLESTMISDNPERLDIFYSFLKTTLSVSDIKSCLMQEAAGKRNAETFLKLFDIIRDTLIENELSELLKNINGDGDNILHSVAANPHQRVVERVFEALSTSLCSDEILKTLLSKNKIDEIPLHTFITSRNLNEFMNCLTILLSHDQLKHILIGSNCFMIAAKHNSSTCIDTIWSFMKKILDLDELQYCLKIKSFKRTNVLQEAARWSTVEMVFKVLEILMCTLNREELVEFLRHVDDSGDNLLHHAMKNENNVFEIILKFLAEHLTLKEIQSMITQSDKNDQTPLDYIKSWKSSGEFENILKTI
jgi:DNA-binding transcriptional MerR regulator